MIIYVDVRHGDNIHGDGSTARPYKTLTKAVSFLSHGDEIIVNDAIVGDFEDYVFEEPNTVELIGLTNVTIRFISSPGTQHTHTVWKPVTVGARKANLYLENCNDVRIDGATFLSTSALVDHAYAIRVVNSSDISISSCVIHALWTVDQFSPGELFSLYGSNATVSDCSFDFLDNSYSNTLAFIAVDGSGDYNLFSNRCSRLISNNGTFRGIWVKPETRKVTIDGFLANDIRSDLYDHAIGIEINSDNSQVEFVVNGAKFSNIHVGMRVDGIPAGGLPRRIKHCTFYKTRVALRVVDASVEFYSCSVYGDGETITHEYPPGHVETLPTYAIHATDYSTVDCLNLIGTELGTVLLAELHSNIVAAHVVWHNCAELKRYNNESSVIAVEYIRRVDPMYADITNSVVGDFALADGSPCIDSGKKYGDPYLGVAPDIGAMERSRALRIDDLPALIARSSRYVEKIPLTNIDIEGMIVQGLDTYDPEVKAGREGSAVRDIAVKPLIGMLAPYTEELEYIRDGLSFFNLENLPEDAADSLASNVFVTRKTGDVASGVIRVFFQEPMAVTMPAELEFISSGGLRFYSTQSVTITAEEMALNYDNGLYYVDILVEAAETGAKYNIEAGAITRTTSPMPTTVVAVLNPNVFSGGDNTESNAELKSRVELAITVRDLVTKKGISYVVPDMFPFVREIRPIGFRDPEMLRDEILGYHIGGKVDIYIRTAAPAEDAKIVQNATASIPINLNEFGNVPVLRVVKIEILDPLTLDSTDIFIPCNRYYIKVNNPKTRFSLDEDNEIILHNDYVGATIKIYYHWIPEIRALQDWLESSEHRVVCADLMVKHFLPTFVDFSISYYAPKEIEGVNDILNTYLINLKSEAPLQNSDITDYLHSLGATHVIEPFVIRAELHDTDGQIIVNESEDELVTARTSVFIARSVSAVYMGVDPKDI